MKGIICGLPHRFGASAVMFFFMATLDICSMPSHGGDCAAYIVLWYYDKDRARCLQFVYTGCGGNANRFQTQEECEGRCQGQTPYDPTLQVTGLGKKFDTMWTLFCLENSVSVVLQLYKGILCSKLELSTSRI